MILRFTLDDQVHELDLRRVSNKAAIAAQKVTGADSWDAVLSQVDDGDATAITALVWTALKKDDPDLRFSDVEFSIYDWRSREFIDPDADTAGDVDADPTEAATGA